MTSLQSAFGLPFLGERLGGRQRALLIAETPVSAETAGPESLLQREKDRKRGWNESPSPGAIFFLPLSTG
jgi:hypothetical protein